MRRSCTWRARRPGHYDIDDILERFKPAAERAQAEPKPPARFALYNVQVRDGALSFDDRPVARRHEVGGLLLTLPFLSTLPSQVEVAVEPRLAFTFDGTRFDTGAQTTPFARDRETSMTLHMGDFDLTIAKPYLPPDLPVDLQRGRVQADLSLHFELRDDNSSKLSLRGGVKMSDIALADRAGAPLAAWRELQVGLTDVQPLERTAALGTVRFEGLDVALTRDAQGRVNVLQLAPPAQGNARPRCACRGGDAAAKDPWEIRVQSFELGGARVRWNDALTPRPMALSFDGIDSTIGPITWPVTQPAALALKGQLHEVGKDAVAATLELQGNATRRKPTRRCVCKRLIWPCSCLTWCRRSSRASKAARQPTRRSTGRPTHRRSPSTWPVPASTRCASSIRNKRRAATRRRPRDAVAWKRLDVADVQLDVPGRKVAIGQIALHDPQFVVERASDGGINVTRWMAAPAKPSDGDSAPARPVAEAVSTLGGASPWQVALAQLAIDGGQLSWRDEAAPGSTAQDPVLLDVHGLRVGVSGLSWPVASTQAQVQLSAQVADPAATARAATRCAAAASIGKAASSPRRWRCAARCASSAFRCMRSSATPAAASAPACSADRRNGAATSRCASVPAASRPT